MQLYYNLFRRSIEREGLVDYTARCLTDWCKIYVVYLFQVHVPLEHVRARVQLRLQYLLIKL